MSEPNILIRDIRQAIDNDEYMWIVVWGPPRTGKSMLCLLTLYWIYQDWEKVLNAIVFNLNQLLYKMQHGIPELWPTRNQLHMRIPCVVWDDWAVHSGKARTQHSIAWDYFKGAFDSLGTKLGVLIANMVSPASPTQQLTEKYTHEIWVPYKGHAKYDKVKQQQDYRGFKSRSTKVWLTEFDFEPIPNDIFKQYDEMRCSLADEALVAIQDVMATTEVDAIMKRMQPMDLQLLTLIQDKGPIYAKVIQEELGDEGKNSLTRMKARGLITPIKVGEHYYKYDATDLGLTVLKEASNPERQKIPTFLNT